MLNGLTKSNGWFPTMFDDFFNTDFMPRANSTAPAVNVKERNTSMRTSIITICAASSATLTTSRTMCCLTM